MILVIKIFQSPNFPIIELGIQKKFKYQLLVAMLMIENSL
jgi:hypothetical protein